MIDLTIGMAHFDDPRAALVLQALAMTHGRGGGIELLAIDNSPHTPFGQSLKSFCDSSGGIARYIPMPEATGTSQPRNRIFAEARGEAVLAMDCHVVIDPGAIARLIRWYQQHPGSLDLLSGPMLYNDRAHFETHFRDEWGEDGMWGKWGRDDRAADPNAAPFEIPGMGLGLFTCRKDAWLGFNEHFRGFGGEEMYIHEKFRRAGHKALCLPFLRWWHDFSRPGGVRYPLNMYDRARNYLLGHLELGLDVEIVRRQFVDTGRLTPQQWEHLLADPVQHTRPATATSCQTVANANLPPADSSLDQIFDWTKSRPRDLDLHLPKLRELAGQVAHVTEFTKRRESTVGLAAGRPQILISYQKERDPLNKLLHAAVQADADVARALSSTGGKNPKAIATFASHEGADSLAVEQIAETDLLFIDSVHHADRLWAELEKHGGQVRRYLVVRGTQAFGERAEGGNGPGLMPALRRWMRERPEWSVVYHSVEQYGLTVLSRDERDKPKLPGMLTMAANFSKALASHVADGATKVELPILEARLNACSACEHRRDDRCSICGCFLAEKAAWRSSECPIGRWAEREAPPVKEAA
jgi:hypothetical protein